MLLERIELKHKLRRELGALCTSTTPTELVLHCGALPPRIQTPMAQKKARIHTYNHKNNHAHTLRHEQKKHTQPTYPHVIWVVLTTCTKQDVRVINEDHSRPTHTGVVSAQC